MEDFKDDKKEDLAKDIKAHKGRTKISDSRREGSFSKRALEGTLEVLYKKCPKCCHHKAFSNMSGTKKCCRCRHVE